jgi:hypothetical protein
VKASRAPAVAASRFPGRISGFADADSELKLVGRGKVFERVFQEELKQRQVVVPRLPAQEDVALQPAVKVLDQTAGPHNLIGCRPGANGLNGLFRNFPLHRLSGRHAEVDTRSEDVAEQPFCAKGWSVRAARTRCLSSSRELQVKHKVALRSPKGCASGK